MQRDRFQTAEREGFAVVNQSIERVAGRRQIELGGEPRLNFRRRMADGDAPAEPVLKVTARRQMIGVDMGFENEFERQPALGDEAISLSAEPAPMRPATGT